MRAPVGPPRAQPPADLAGMPPGWAATAHPSSTQTPKVEAAPPSLTPPSEADPQQVPTVFHGNPFSAAVAAVTSRPSHESDQPSFEVEEPPPEETPAAHDPYAQDPYPEDQPPAAPDDLGLDLDLPPPDEAAPAAAQGNGFALSDHDFAGPPSVDPALDDAAAQQSGGDDNPFQIDMGAPPAPVEAPRTNAAAEALSMLDFDDAGGGEKAGPVRWTVKRRSGKTFGPFDAPTIAAMLQQGQLFGNEEISVDGQSWEPIGAEPEFAKEIKSQESEAAEPPGLAPLSSPRIAAPVMSAASIAPREATGGSQKSPISSRRVPVWARLIVRRLPLLAAVAGVIAVVGGGLALGKFTNYGYFGMNLIKGKTQSAGKSDTKTSEVFNAAIAEGTFPGLQKALGAAQSAITTDPESPEAAMDLAIVSSRLTRRYGASKTELDRARTLLETKIDPKSAESKIGLAAIKLADGKAGDAHGLLTPFAKDRRAEILLAETMIAEHQNKAALTQLDGFLTERPSGEGAMLKAEAAHNLPDEALERAALDQALAKVPGHARARLWQARLEVAAKKPDEAVKLLTPLLAAPDVKNLETTEEAVGHHLMGDIYLARKQINEAAQEYTKAADGDPSSPEHRIAAAQILLRRRQWPEAVAAFDKALEKSPTNADLLIGSAKALIETASYQKANARVEEAKKNYSKAPSVAVIAGDLQVALQHYPDAHKAYADAIKLDEKYVPALVADGALYLTEGKTEEAQHSIEKAVQLDPADVAAQTVLGQYYLIVDKPKEAKEAFETAIKVDADRADAVGGLARALDTLDDNAAAAEAYKKAVLLDPRNIAFREQYATFLRKANDLEGALVQLRAGVAVDAKDARLQALIGGVLLDLDQSDEAETTLRKALSLQENDPVAHAYLGRLLSSLKGDTAQGVEHLKRAVTTMPKSADMRYQLGIVYERGQMLGDAADSFKEAIALDENLLDARQHLGQVLSQQGQYSSAIAEFEKVLAKEPKRQGAYADLADAQFKSGDVDSSIKNFKKALEVNPKQGVLQYKLGRAYDKNGKAADAAGAYEAATRLDPTNPLPWYYLGYVYKSRGKNKDAVEAFQSYLKNAKDAKDADEINDEIAFLKESR
jgi:tetratricopeptide (TPR) repeat protein